MVIRLSKSSILTFLECPKKWDMIYRQGVKEPENIWVQRGAFIHEYYENLFKNVKIENGEIFFPPFPPNLDNITKDMINNIMMFELNRFEICKKFNRPDLFVPPHLELKIEKQENGVQLVGVIDRIDEDLDGTKSIMEIKTTRGGSWTPQFQFELSYYRYLLRDRMPIDKAMVFLVRDNKLLSTILNKKHEDWVETIILGVVDKIENDKIYPNPHCKDKFCCGGKEEIL